MSDTSPRDPWADDMPRDPAIDPYARHPWDRQDEPGTNHALGVASLIVGIATWVFGIATFAYMVVLIVNNMVGGELTLAEDDPRFVVTGCGLMLSLLLGLIGTGLGIGGCYIKNRRKTMAIAGLATSGSYLVFIVLFLLAGLIAS